MEIFKVEGCGVTLICEKGETMTGWLTYIIDRGGWPVVTRWATQLLLMMGLFAFSSKAAYNPNELNQLTDYANNAILAAAQDGDKAVTLHCGGANPSVIEKLTDDLRARGYRIDEEAALNNPEVIKVRYYKGAK